MATANNLGTAYIKIAPQTEGIQATIQKAFNKAGSEGGESFNKGFSLATGAIAGAISAVTSKAINAISSQFDNAIKRVDTLNVFPKIMQNLGYETDESTRSLDRLSTRIEGLPTTLDEIVTYTQRLASSLDSLADEEMNATDLALAFNDAALSGGKGQYEANRAFEQYVQIIGRGRPMMQDWKIMLEVMPGQLKQMARYMGENNDSLKAYAKQAGKTVAQLDGMDLYEWISEDKNAYAKERLADFNRALITLDKEGGAGIASFKNQVGDATHTIGTALRLIPVRISKALASVIQAFGAGDIYDVIDKFTKSFKSIGDWIVKYVVPPLKNDILPLIGNVLVALKNVAQFILSNEATRRAVVMLLEAFLAYKAVAPIIVGVTNAVSLLTKGLTAAQAASLGTAAAVTALVLAINFEVEAIKNLAARLEYQANVRKYAAQQTVSENNALRQLNIARENEQKILEDLNTKKRLQNDTEYQELQAKQRLADAQKAYNEILKSSVATDDEKRMKALELKAAEDAYSDAIKSHEKAVESVANAEAELAAGRLTGLHETNLLISKQILQEKQYGTLAKRIDDLKNSTIKYKNAQGETVKMTKDQMKDISDWYAEALGKNDQTWKQIVKYAKDNQLSYVEACERAGWEGGENFNLQFAAGIDAYKPYAVNEAEATVEDVAARVQAITDIKKDYLKNTYFGLGRLMMMGFDEGMQSRVQHLNDTLNNIFGIGLPSAVKKALGIHSPSKVFMTIGQQVGAGLIEGLDSYEDRIESKATELADSVVSPFSKDAQLDLNSNGVAQFNRSPVFSGERYGSGASVVQNNVFNQVADDLDVKEASKLLGFEVATAI